MQTTTVQSNVHTSLEARPAAAAQAKAAPRLGYLSTLRALLTALVIFFHAVITYGGTGDWTFLDVGNDDLTGALLSLFVIATQGYFMGLFFFVSGYLTPGSYDRKGPAQFWKDRLLRLALPMLVYMFFLQRLPNYLDEIRWYGVKTSFWQYCVQNFWSEVDAGPTWFLFALLLFAAGYTLWRLIRRNAPAAAVKMAVPGKIALLGFGLLIGVTVLAVMQASPLGEADSLFGAISMQWGFFPQYILMFAAGILAYRNDWLSRLSGKSLRFWVWMAVAAIIALPVLFILGGAMEYGTEPFVTGFGWPAVAISLWIGFECVAVSMALILWLRERHNTQSPLMVTASASAFTAYLIHPLVLVSLSYFVSFTSLHPLIKLAIVGPLAVLLSFAFSEPIRRLPGLRKIL